MVNVKHKKRAKKASEDGEGEREEPAVYTSAMIGETSQGAGEEGYSRLKLSFASAFVLFVIITQCCMYS